MSPQYQRWSTSTFVTIAASNPRRRNVPSLSSASTTSHSPASSPAFDPTSLSSLPTRKLGCRSAARRMSVIIDVVVVLPCVPATPRARRVVTMPASASARDRTGMPARSAATTSTFVRGTAELNTTASASAGTLSAVWGTRHSTPSSRSRSRRGCSCRSEPLTR
jgi:hypothetical protein